ncbi:MAG: antibiotic biosynthesis monooxygenase [Myxococcales bacterium]|nr:antibiotic biosynthesis monooxygenase [Myxococcales bacterium]
MHTLIRIPALLTLLAAPLACGDSGDATSDTAGATDTAASDASTSSASNNNSSSGETPTTGAESSTGFDPAQLYGCEETMFGASPLAGPLYDPEKGGIQGTLQADYVLHTTQIYLKPEGAQTFLELAQAVSAEAAKTEGLIAFSVGSDNGCGVARTMGIWASEEAMYKLVASDAHAKAMGMTTVLTYTGRVTHWSATAEEANAYTWDVARAKIADVEPSAIY